MGIRDRVVEFVRARDLSTRSLDSFEDHPGLTEQLLAVQGIHSTPWRSLGVAEALAVPAYGRAVQIIASLVGALPLESYYDGALERPTPRIVARPDPWQTARDFQYGVAWNMASRGTAILYAAAVDTDGEPLSILNLPTAECQIDWDERHIERIVTWRGRALATARVRIVRLDPVPESAWGSGPLQRTGAAISAAAEADEWAARYFAEGGVPATHLHSQAKLTDAEAEAIRSRWQERASTVRVTSGGVMTAAPLGVSPHDAQLLDARMHSRGEAAVLFGMPGKFLEYAEQGSSLTYQNVGDLMTEFVRTTLAPLYLSPIEAALTDFLVRRRSVRFDLAELQRADPKTRFDIHAIAIAQGIYDAQYAQVVEGIAPGASSTAPTPGPGPIPSIPDAYGVAATSSIQ
jgi:HK97 family phage portal protein